MSLGHLQDEAWKALGPRRFLLGRDRCDRLVRIASDVLSHEQAYASAAMHEGYRKQVEDTVRGVYSEKCSGVFLTLVLYASISAIVQFLVKRWLENREGS